MQPPYVLEDVHLKQNKTKTKPYTTQILGNFSFKKQSLQFTVLIAPFLPSNIFLVSLHKYFIVVYHSSRLSVRLLLGLLCNYLQINIACQAWKTGQFNSLCKQPVSQPYTACFHLILVTKEVSLMILNWAFHQNQVVALVATHQFKNVL